MCTECYDEDAKKTIRFGRELRDHLGGATMRLNQSYSGPDSNIEDFMDTCLCPFNVPEILLYAGKMVWYDDEWCVIRFRNPV